METNKNWGKTYIQVLKIKDRFKELNTPTYNILTKMVLKQICDDAGSINLKDCCKEEYDACILKLSEIKNLVDEHLKKG